MHYQDFLGGLSVSLDSVLQGSGASKWHLENCVAQQEGRAAKAIAFCCQLESSLVCQGTGLAGLSVSRGFGDIEYKTGTNAWSPVPACIQ